MLFPKMNYKLLILLSSFALIACSNTDDPVAANPLVTEDDVLLVLVDGEPITLPMLEYTMEARGVAEDDEDGMRSLLDELIRLQAVANAARESGLTEESRVRALRRLRELEAIQMSYFGQLAEDEPVTDQEVQAVYDSQAATVGDQQYQIETVVYANQPSILSDLARLDASDATYEELLAEARELGRPVDQPLWVDLSQLPPDVSAALRTAEVGEVLPLPLQTAQGWRIVRLIDKRAFEPPALSEVRQGIVRTIARERVTAHVDSLYESAEITPMLPLDDADESDADNDASDN